MVINPARHFHKGDGHRFIKSREILIPGKYIERIEDGKIKLKLDQSKLLEHEYVGINRFIEKDIRALEKGFDEIGSAYHYYVYSAKKSQMINKLQNKKKKTESSLKILKAIEYDSRNPSCTTDFVRIFNEVALTSVDPYEELKVETAAKHFAKGSHLIYLGAKVIGYSILSWKDTPFGKIGSIAGIGLHHSQRGKGYATPIISQAADFFNRKGEFFALEADILVGNDASIGLFESLGFEKDSDFYLC